MKCILPLSLFLTKWHAFVCVLNLFSVQTDLILFYFFQAGIVQAAQIMFSKLHRAGAERINVSIVTSSHVTERFSCGYVQRNVDNGCVLFFFQANVHSL